METDFVTLVDFRKNNIFKKQMNEIIKSSK